MSVEACQSHRHVWTYPGRKWPYAGQLCVCGEKAWPRSERERAAMRVDARRAARIAAASGAGNPNEETA